MTTPHPTPEEGMTPEERYEALCRVFEHTGHALAGFQADAVMKSIREAEAAGEARGRAMAIAAVEQVAASQGRAECCGCGISLGGPPECCNDPLYMISDRDAIAAIRAHTDKESSDD